MRPIGDWSISITLSIWLERRRCRRGRPGRLAARCSRWASAGCRVSLTSVLLPEPETPVTQTKPPSGIATSTFLRLLLAGADGSRARCRCRARRSRGHGDRSLAGRELAGERVRVGGDSRRACPAATTWPPCSPAPGPMSIRWSAARMVSSSCSTTSTVLPRSRSRVERRDQALVVALVQADRRLVEHVAARRPGRSRSGSRGGCAAPRRRESVRAERDEREVARGRRSPGSRAVRRSRVTISRAIGPLGRRSSRGRRSRRAACLSGERAVLRRC